MKHRKHNLKKNVNYTKKHSINVSDILSKDLVQLRSLNRETLRRSLVVINQESNKILDKLSKTNYENRIRLSQKPVLADRITGEKGVFKRFSTTGINTKEKYIQEIIARKQFLEQVPTPSRIKEKNLERDNIVLEYIENYTDYSYDKIEGQKPTLKKLGKLLQRLEDDNYIAAHAKTSGYSLGSETVIGIAFSVAFEHPYWGVDKLYKEIEKRLEDAKIAVQIEKVKTEEEFERGRGLA